MAAKLTKIVLPEDLRAIQPALFEVPKVWNPFPPISKKLEDFRDVLNKNEEMIGLDLEYYKKDSQYHPSIIGISSNDLAVALPYSIELAAEVYEKAERGKKLVGHAVIGADRPVLDRACKTVSKLEWWEDSMLYHYLNFQSLCKGSLKEEDEDDSGSLGFMGLWSAASMLPLDLWNWKQCPGPWCEGKICPTHAVFEYCAIDSWAGLKIVQHNRERLLASGVKEWVFRDIHDLAYICHVMEEQGIRINLEYVAELRERMAKEKDAIFEHTLDEAGEKVFRYFNPNSPAQVLAWFSANGLILEKADKNTIVKALEKQAKTRGFLNFEELLEQEENPLVIQQLGKLWDFKEAGKGPIWFQDKYLTKGFAHPRFIITGASSGRMASSRPNFQNVAGNKGWAKDLKKCIIPRSKDLCFVESDSSQLELRQCLYLANEDTNIANHIFEDIVEKSNGAFKKAAELAHNTERFIAKSIVHACLTKNHEVLTKNGWIHVNEWNGEEICQWQYPQDGFMTFAKPEKYHAYDFNDELLVKESRYLSFAVTKNHRIPTISKQKKWQTKEIQDYEKWFKVPLNGILKSSGTNHSLREIQQAVAVQADGSFEGNNVNFGFRRERKIVRFNAIFQCRGQRDNSGTFRATAKAWKSSLIDSQTKEFTSEIFNLSLAQRRWLINELRFWDGTVTKKGSYCYYTTSKKCADLIQALCHVSGFTACISWKDRDGRQRLWRVTYGGFVNFSVLGTPETKKYCGKVYCFTMPAGHFLIRHNGVVSITGNSNYLESFKILKESDLEKPNIKSEIASGALQVHRDWHYGGGIVAFTGANLSERLFGSRTRENRALALTLRRNYTDSVPAIENWQRKQLEAIERLNITQHPSTGRFLRLHDTPEENAKIGIAFLGQGGGAQYITGIMLRFWRELHEIPLMNVHDSLVFEKPMLWSDKECRDFISLMYEETPQMPGFKAPGKPSRGPNYGELEKI